MQNPWKDSSWHENLCPDEQKDSKWCQQQLASSNLHYISWLFKKKNGVTYCFGCVVWLRCGRGQLMNYYFVFKSINLFFIGLDLNHDFWGRLISMLISFEHTFTGQKMAVLGFVAAVQATSPSTASTSQASASPPPPKPQAGISARPRISPWSDTVERGARWEERAWTLPFQVLFLTVSINLPLPWLRQWRSDRGYARHPLPCIGVRRTGRDNKDGQTARRSECDIARFSRQSIA